MLRPMEWWVRELGLAYYPNEIMSQVRLCASEAFLIRREGRRSAMAEWVSQRK